MVKVDLMDPSCEPTDAELEELMRVTHVGAMRKYDETMAAFRDNLSNMIRDAVTDVSHHKYLYDDVPSH